MKRIFLSLLCTIGAIAFMFSLIAMPTAFGSIGAAYSVGVVVGFMIIVTFIYFYGIVFNDKF